MTASAVLFPGQGAQYVGMGKKNHEAHPSARALLDRAAGILGFDLTSIMFEGPKEELDRTEISQPAIFAASAASLAAHGETGESLGNPVVAAGLSLGEYTALYFAGVLTFEDALRLVALRGRAMQAACDEEPSGMISLMGMDRAAALEVIEESRGMEVLVIANLNAPGQVVIAGHLAALRRAEGVAKARGAKSIALAVAGAFHSPLMEPAREDLEKAIRLARFSPPRFPVISNVTARPMSSENEIREALVSQLTLPVLWADSMATMAGLGVGIYYEVGPGRVLAGLARRIDRSLQVISIDDVEAKK